MAKILTVEQLNESKGSKLHLSKKDREFLFKKVEYTKKKKMTELKNDVYDLFNGDKNDLNAEEVEKMLKSLEYTFKTKSNHPILQKMMEFVPDWIPIKSSSLTAKLKRDNKNQD